MGVRLYNVECKFCGLNHDLIFSGESTPNYGVFIMNTDLLAQNSCPRCHRTDSQIPSKAHELVGEALEKSRQPNSESAISDVLEAVRIAPNSSYINNQASNVFAICGDPNNSLKYALLAVKMGPSLMDPYTNVGDAYVNLGRDDEAIGYYLKAIDIDPDEPVTHGSIAGSYSRLGDRKSAIGHYEYYLEHDGSNPSLIYDAADEYELVGNIPKAKILFKKVCTILEANGIEHSQAHSRLAMLENR
jgi:tetratricopeptide (TPR) repeat protein